MTIRIMSSGQFDPNQRDGAISRALGDLRVTALQETVQSLSFPRNYRAESSENLRAADLIRSSFDDIGYTTAYVGSYKNVFAYTDACVGKRSVLVCAHFDSVPGCPAADDNASAIAGQRELARLAWNHFRNLPIAFIAVNREEDGLLGSAQFVDLVSKDRRFRFEEVYNLEMIGFASHEEGSQRFPPGLQLPGMSRGDFLALVGNDHGHESLRALLQAGRDYAPELPIIGLHISGDPARAPRDLLRSDHASFWDGGIHKAVQLTDTANFRNPNYHKLTDTPETLNYDFMRDVTSVVFATIVTRAQSLKEG